MTQDNSNETFETGQDNESGSSFADTSSAAETGRKLVDLDSASPDRTATELEPALKQALDNSGDNVDNQAIEKAVLEIKDNLVQAFSGVKEQISDIAEEGGPLDELKDGLGKVLHGIQGSVTEAVQGGKVDDAVDSIKSLVSQLLGSAKEAVENSLDATKEAVRENVTPEKVDSTLQQTEASVGEAIDSLKKFIK